MSTVHRVHDLTDVLGAEHALLLRALDLFERFAECVRAGREFDAPLARRFLRFFREFADVEHHHKEEAILFPWLEEHGMPHEVGPLVVLREEHELGRDLRLALSLALDALGEEPREVETRQRFHALALRFTRMSREHIEKEEAVLLPLARRFAHQLREMPVVPAGPRPESGAWLDAVQAGASHWPALVRVPSENGTPYAFERLCEECMH